MAGLGVRDYYPYGMAMIDRKYNAVRYRYSINGQEKELEINENITTAMYWCYDSRIGRRWNMDPVVKPFESPYLCFSGNPVLHSDELGDEPFDSKKTARSIRRYEKLFKRYLKANYNSERTREENIKAAHDYMEQTYNLKRWMWVREVSGQHMHANKENDNGATYYHAGDIFKFKNPEWATQSQAQNTTQGNAIRVISTRYVGTVIMNEYDGSGTNRDSRMYTYQIPPNSAGQLTVTISITDNATKLVNVIQSGALQSPWGVYGFPSLTGGDVSVTDGTALGPFNINSSNGMYINVIVTGNASVGYNEFGHNNIQPVLTQPAPQAPTQTPKIQEPKYYQIISGEHIKHPNRLTRKNREALSEKRKNDFMKP